MSSTGSPKVSVVVTTYKRAKILPATLDSILAQTLTDFELIVSDDRSPDNTREVVEGYAQRDPRVRYRCNEKNLRMPGNLNAGIAAARGEYVANLHDGDIYRSDLLEKWAGALDRHPSTAFVFNQYYEMITKRGQPTQVLSSVYDMPECIDGREFLRKVFLGRWGSPVWGTVMARRACYEAVGPFNARYSFSSDVEMWVRLASRYDVAYVAEPLIELSMRESNHLMSGHKWWEVTFDVESKRMAMRTLHPNWHPARLGLELKARGHYLWSGVPELRRGRFRGFFKALYLAVSGRDNIAPPY